MDQPGGNKTKNWLYRIRHLNLGTRKIQQNSEEPVLRRISMEQYDETNRSCNFRKSLRKMHSRVKNYKLWQKNKSTTARHTIHVSENIPSSSNISRAHLSLMSFPSIVENIYSSEPVHKDVSPPPPLIPLRKSVHDSRNGEQDSDTHIERTRSIHNGRGPTGEINVLANCYWYFGPLSQAEANKRLCDQPDGAFLVRDSSSTSFLFSISFRCVGTTLHSRILYNGGKYSLFDREGYDSITELIDNALMISKDGVYCYSINQNESVNFPVRLTKPLSRYLQVRSLKFLCRFVIRQETNINDITKLPLPSALHSYLQENNYF